jgi:hypothetical protein
MDLEATGPATQPAETRPATKAYACPMHPEVQSDQPGICRICKMDLEATGPATQPAETRPATKAYACPMHPEVQSDQPGTCRICKMDLEATGPATQPAESQPTTQPSSLPLAVPRSAVLDTGKRRIVWVETAPGAFEAREVVLGPRCGDDYPVLSGLAEGERVVVRGNFLLDSQAQISGKPSLLFPKGLAPADSGAGHAGHGDMKR